MSFNELVRDELVRYGLARDYCIYKLRLLSIHRIITTKNNISDGIGHL